MVSNDVELTPLKPIQYENRVSILEWTEVEVTKMNKFEFLKYLIMGKFVQGWPNLGDLRKNLPL